MPARTVIFDSNRKHDGIRTRDLNPGRLQEVCLGRILLYSYPRRVHSNGWACWTERIR